MPLLVLWWGADDEEWCLTPSSETALIPLGWGQVTAEAIAFDSYSTQWALVPRLEVACYVSPLIYSGFFSISTPSIFFKVDVFRFLDWRQSYWTPLYHIVCCSSALNKGLEHFHVVQFIFLHQGRVTLLWRCSGNCLLAEETLADSAYSCWLSNKPLKREILHCMMNVWERQSATKKAKGFL